MWRLSAIARSQPKTSGGVRAGMRRNRTTAAVTTTNTDTIKFTAVERNPWNPGFYALQDPISTQQQQQQQQQQPLPNKQVRWFHASSRTGAKQRYGIGMDDNSSSIDDDIDPDDPDDIPDFLDNEDFARMVGDDIYNDGDDDDAEEEARERYRLQQEKVNDELDSRKGRPWRDPWEIHDDLWMQSDTSSDSLPDWSPSYVSRVSQERLQVLSAADGKGVPTLGEIAGFSLPAADPALHPARKTKTYAAYRKSRHYGMVKECVAGLAKDRVGELLEKAAAASSAASGEDGTETDDWSDAVDALFEDLQEEAKADPSMDILSKHPAFPSWVDRGLEEFLQASQKEALQKQEQQEENNTQTTTTAPTASPSDGPGEKEASDNNDDDDTNDAASSSPWRDDTPVFMDCYDPSEGDAGPMVPGILAPLAPHKHGGPGKMVEEWELSAHPGTKRIMLRESTQAIARALLERKAPRVYVHGRRGVGKSAALASIVASLRKTGAIVFYLPDGDRLRKNGFYVTPSTHPDRKGVFDLPDLSQEALVQLLGSHDTASKMEGMVADRDTLKAYFKETQLKKLDEFLGSDDDGGGGGSVSLLDLVAYAKEHKKHAPMCYSVVLNRLMNQTEERFVIVVDEFNCLFDRGHYFHMAYDKDVRKAIPYDKINLFEPILAAMDLTTKTAEEEEDEAYAASLLDGDDGETGTTGTAAAAGSSFETAHTAVVVATTESHAVRREVTEKLTACADRRVAAADGDDDAAAAAAVAVVEIPRFSSLEADHILANFEATGIGKLRLDRGDTLLNPQEVEYLKMASGSVGQKLLDVSIF